MKKIIILIVLIFTIAFLLKNDKKEYLPNSENLTVNNVFVNQQIEEENEKRTNLYKYSIKLIISNVSEYLDDKEYIAIQSKEFVDLNEVQIQEIFTYISDLYNIAIIDGNYDDLIELGIEDGNGEQKGIFIQIPHIEMQVDSAEVHIGATYASLGAEGYKINVIFREGKWLLLNMELLWEA